MTQTYRWVQFLVKHMPLILLLPLKIWLRGLPWAYGTGGSGGPGPPLGFLGGTQIFEGTLRNVSITQNGVVEGKKGHIRHIQLIQSL